MYRKLLLLLTSAVMLAGCSAGESAVDNDKNGMLNLSVLESPVSDRKEYRAQFRDLSTEVELSASREYLFSDSVNCPDSVGEMKVSEIMVEDGQLISQGDKLLTITRTYDRIKRKEKEIAYDRALEDYKEKCSGYELSLSEAREAAKAAPEDNSLTLKVEQIEFDYQCYIDTETESLNSMKAVIGQYDDIDKNPVIDILSPSAGKVQLAKISGTVSSGMLLANIIDVNSVIYSVPSNYESLNSGKILEMTSEAGDKITGKVISNDKDFEYISGGAFIRVIAVNGDEQFDLSTLSETVSFKTHPIEWKNVLTLELSAIQKDSAGFEYVNRLMEDGSTERVYISRYLEINNYTWIVRGLEEGDICVTE